MDFPNISYFSTKQFCVHIRFALQTNHSEGRAGCDVLCNIFAEASFHSLQKLKTESNCNLRTSVSLVHFMSQLEAPDKTELCNIDASEWQQHSMQEIHHKRAPLKHPVEVFSWLTSICISINIHLFHLRCNTKLFFRETIPILLMQCRLTHYKFNALSSNTLARRLKKRPYVRSASSSV